MEKTTIENSKILRNLEKVLNNSTRFDERLDSVLSEKEILDFDCNIPFPIDQKEVIAKNDISVNNSSSFIANEDGERTEKSQCERYSTMVEVKVVKSKKESTKKAIEQVSLEEMLMTTQELQNWATNVLDKPELLIEDLDPNNPDPDRVTSVPLHEAVDIGALDVLLNACKPSLFDSKPPIRLNVVQEVAPPDLLVKNLQKTLGVSIENGNGSQEKSTKSIPGFGYHSKSEKRIRPKYGHWYIRPSQWEGQMKSHNNEKSEKETVQTSLGLHEMIQKKLEEIKANQEREDAEILAENTMKPIGKKN